jgi:transcriptional regulator NrdR family protein
MNCPRCKSSDVQLLEFGEKVNKYRCLNCQGRFEASDIWEIDEQRDRDLHESGNKENKSG